MNTRAADRPTGTWASIRPFVALGAGPGAWILQLVLDYALSGYACHPGDAPRLSAPAGGWGAEDLALVAINLLCLAVAVAGGSLAFASWRHTERAGADGASEIVRATSQFLALCGMMSAAGFTVAILFDTVLPYTIPSCWRFSP